MAAPRCMVSCLLAACLAIVAYSTAIAGVPVTVDARANVFGSGKTSLPGGGVWPPVVPFGTSEPVVVFPAVAGLVSGWDLGCPFVGPDGGRGCGNRTSVASSGGISGIVYDDGVMFLVGVFLDDSTPVDPAPPIVNWTGANEQSDFFPVLRQTFFVGDGRDSAGELQRFHAPSRATRLFLGFAETFGFSTGQGPSHYNDNAGELEAEVLVADGLSILTDALAPVAFGEPSSRQLEALLGTPPYEWSVAAGTPPPGMELGAGGVLSGAPTEAGVFAFTARVTDDVGDTDERELQLEVLATLPQPALRILKRGTRAVLARDMTYTILVENRGPATVSDQAVTEALQPWFTYVAASPEPTERRDGALVWELPPLAPGERFLISYVVDLEHVFPATELGIPLNFEVTGGPACVHERVGECVLVWTQALNTCQKECVSTHLDDSCQTTTCVSFGVEFCFPSPGLGGYDAGCMLEAIDCVRRCEVRYLTDALPSCFSPQSRRRGFGSTARDDGPPPGFPGGTAECTSDPAPVSRPVDPNEKLVLAERFIRPDQTLVYPIHFENIGDIEARDVFVTDVLDADLDPSSVEILSPGGSVDEPSGTVRFDLLGIDLPAGAHDSVLFSVKPRPGLPSGTEIRNTADIQFEVFDVITTPEVVSVIDGVAPTCTMDALPAITGTPRFEISWSGSDPVGEIASYSIFVSVDGGGFTPLLHEESETSAIFAGEQGRQYGFLCIAADTAGNVEVQPPTAEATTRLRITDFLCYAAKPPRGSAKFEPIEGLPLDDQFEDGFFDVIKPVTVCNPAAADPATLPDPDTHLVGYKIKGPKHEKRRAIRIDNDLGTTFVDTKKADRLLVPSSKSLDGPVPPPDPGSHGVDHYKCYKVGGTGKICRQDPSRACKRDTDCVDEDPLRFTGPCERGFDKKQLRGTSVWIDDQFPGTPKLFDVKRPTALCAPVDKSGEGIEDPRTHLTCYRIKTAKRVCAADSPANVGGACRAEPDCGGVEDVTSHCTRQPKHETLSGVHVSNQLGAAELDALGEAELCLPSWKTSSGG